MSVEVQYITELRNWKAQSLKFFDKSRQGTFNSKAKGTLVFASTPRLVCFGVEKPYDETDHTTPHFFKFAYILAIDLSDISEWLR
jgi:hypothetical protein